jgi:hypothetical protein
MKTEFLNGKDIPEVSNVEDATWETYEKEK